MVEMDLPHWCGYHSHCTECKKRHRDGGERVQQQDSLLRGHPDRGERARGLTEYGQGTGLPRQGSRCGRRMVGYIIRGNCTLASRIKQVCPK